MTRTMERNAVREGASTRSLPGEDEVEGQTHQASLLIIDELSSRRLALPDDGVLTFGRSTEADVELTSPTISRLHAKLIIAGGEVQVSDLDSHNGTLVNGEKVRGAERISSGDVITLGDAFLVLRAAPQDGSRQASDMVEMRRRLEEEVARAAEFGRPFAVIALRFTPGRHRTAIGAAALSVLRRMDFLAFDSSGLVVLLPELEGEGARAVALQLIATVASWSPDARGGVASYPSDGSSVETLLGGARSASNAASEGAVCVASETAVRHCVGKHTIVVADDDVVHMYELIRRLATKELSVLILGETGTGKENAASALHYWSNRAEKPFVALNCAALPESLVESEFFGHVKGAFTGAISDRMGAFEEANGGTLFLDEVGDLPLSIQVKLLRVLEERRVTRLGSRQKAGLDIDIRVVAATNRDLEADVRAGRFRQDLLFRLSAALVELPPLRHRRREISLLARLFVEMECAKKKLPPIELTEEALACLAQYNFPGNIRELKNAMEYAIATAEGGAIRPWNLPKQMRGSRSISVEESTPSEEPTPHCFRPIAEELRKLERARMVEALKAMKGVQKRAAEAIGMPVRTFTFKMRQYKISCERASTLCPSRKNGILPKGSKSMSSFSSSGAELWVECTWPKIDC